MFGYLSPPQIKLHTFLKATRRERLQNMVNCHILVRMARKAASQRPYPPDFISADTLAYRLDYSRSSVDDFVRRGLLPPPVTVGANPRWHWPQVEEFILVRNGRSLAAQGAELDPFAEGLSRVAPSRS